MISIVIPTYNRAHLIARAINSVVQQTLTEWQLIIVDDGSKDETEKVVAQFLSDKRIQFVKKPNSGAAHTRNVGVEHAIGEWITFLDSDDEAKVNWLQRVHQEIQNGAEIISCGLDKFNEKGLLIETRLPHQNRTQTGGQFTNGGVYFLKTAVFRQIGGFDEKVRSGQHTELHFRIREYAIANNIVTTLIPEPLVNIHIHTGYRIRSDSNAKYEGSLYTYRKHYDRALRSKKMRSLYEGIIAYNAFKIKKYNEAVRFGFKSFVNKPNRKTLKRFLRYLIRK